LTTVDSRPPASEAPETVAQADTRVLRTYSISPDGRQLPIQRANGAAPNEAASVKRVPWSVLGPEFVAKWGRPRGKNEPEHLEILGPTGSGKTVLLRDIIIERARRRQTHMVFVATKAQDSTVKSLRWPVVDDWKGVTQNPQVVFWPRTKHIGRQRKEYQAAKIEDLLSRLWQPDANTVVIFDEFMYVESLDPELKAILGMYLREGRSHGITVVMGKQRPQGVQRDMHSESDWKFAFRMNDRADNERLAELFGRKQDWIPVIQSLNREKFEFLVQHKMTDTTYISWVDRPVKAPDPDSYRKKQER
jgi:hypothetical protein